MAIEQPRRRRRSASAKIVLGLAGYKAIRTHQQLSLAAITVIAGANSSGKSSFMQPFLMMKQTLESVFDPGPLLLYGPNVKNTQLDQVFSRGKSRTDQADEFTIELSHDAVRRSVTYGRHSSGTGVRILSDTRKDHDSELTLTDPLSPENLESIRPHMEASLRQIGTLSTDTAFARYQWRPELERQRCFLSGSIMGRGPESGYDMQFPFGLNEPNEEIALLRGIIHVPGLRGNPERAYVRSATGDTFPGTFDTYVASILMDWADSHSTNVGLLSSQLEELGLTWKVHPRRLNDASIEIKVGRTPHAQQGGANDLVSVADVGFGVSQVLPALVALIEAHPGQIVYLEQPETHLHPRAQLVLASHLAVAARRGVRVVLETHSSLLLRGIQTLVATGDLSSSDVSMNWFSRDSLTGYPVVTVADLDQKGRFGLWPVDFDEVSRDADWAFIEASERA